MSVWAYAVHGNSEAFFGGVQELRQSRSETAVKEQAIRSHKTQLMLSRRRFLAYAARPECFLKLESHERTHADGPIRLVSRQTHVLRVRLLLSTKPMGATGATLFVLGHDIAGRLRCVRMRVPVRSSAAEVFDCHTGEHLELARYHGTAYGGEFAIPVATFSAGYVLFVKLERPSWFFDEAGWLETPPIVVETAPTRMAKTLSLGPEVLS
jgi:hypothetical protein